MRVFVVGDRPLDVAFKAVNGQVHFGKADGGGVLFETSEGETVGRTLALFLLDDAGALHEHAAGACGRVEHCAMLWVEHMGDQRYQREGGEELAAVVSLLIGELGEEVLVDATEDVARDLLQLIRVERAQELSQDGVIQLLILGLGQSAAQVLVICFNRLHRLNDRLCSVRVIRERHEIVELSLWLKEDGVLLREVLFDQRPRLATTRGQVCLNFVPYCQIAAVGVPQKYETHNGQEVLIASIVRVGAERVCRVPEAFFDGFDMFQLWHTSSILLYPWA